MRSGDLRKRITLQRPVVTRDAEGDETRTWMDVRTVWAQIEPLSGREFFEVQVQTGEITTRIRIRYMQGITTMWRVKYRARYFEIVAPPINLNERNLYLDMMCKEIVEPWTTYPEPPITN